jgi:hypothetical protein
MTRCVRWSIRESFATSNDIEFSGERKRVRCNEGLGRAVLLRVHVEGKGNVLGRKEPQALVWEDLAEIAATVEAEVALGRSPG